MPCILAYSYCWLVHVWCVYVCVTLVDTTKMVCDKSAIFHHLVGIQKPINVFGDVAHDLDLLFEGQRLNPAILED